MPAKEKAIVEGIESRKDDYFSSEAFSYFKEQGNAVSAAVDQKYLSGERTTRSGFYLGATTSQYEALTQHFSKTFSDPRPLFIFDSKRMGGEDLALLAQRFLNRVWDNMGVDNSGGVPQWIQLCRDVPIFNMAVAHPCWKRVGGYKEKPVVNEGAWAPIVEWSKEFDILLNEPDIQRIHPFNWFGQFDRCRDLSYEGFIDEWDPCIVAALLNDESYKQENLQKLAEEMKKGQRENDDNFYSSDKNKAKSNTSRSATVTVYWGTLNHIKGMEDDPNEYFIICDSKRIYKMKVNHIPGFRQIVRVRSEILNDFPFGRSLLAPSLPHTKILNLFTNLGIDDTIMRMHNGWAVWEQFLVNTNEFMNPEGTNNTVRMRKDAPADKIPKRIGGESSGVMNDMFQMYSLIKRDNETVGLSDQAKGVKSLKKETATGQLIDQQADDLRVLNSVITMSQTGLKPIAKQVLMMALRNTPEIERRNLSYDGEIFSVGNKEMIQIWNNSFFDIDDSVSVNQENETVKLINFLGQSREILLQNPNGLEYLQNMIRDIGRKSGLLNVERYFPEHNPPTIPSQTTTSPQPGAVDQSPGVSPNPAPGAEVSVEQGITV
jgi:hypothetical protein